MVSIHTNLSSLIAQGSLTKSTNTLNRAIEQMSTGYKINHASDNAANYSIKTNMDTKIGAYMVAEDNTAMGIDLLTTAESSLSLIGDKLARLRTLAVQSSNGTYGAESQKAINSEANALIDEMQRLHSTTEYNGKKLLGSSENSGNSASVKMSPVKFTRRDTTNMKKLGEIEDANVALADGTYSISTAEELAQLATMTNAGLISEGDEFVLANDIDLSAYATGEGWTPIGTSNATYFKGCFDGNGYTIKNLYINRPSSNYQGLFGSSTGCLKNVNVKDANITANSGIGILVGVQRGNAIFNCTAFGSIKASSHTIGGIAGQFYGEMKNCSSNVDIEGISSSVRQIGGLIGALDGVTTIDSCYSNSKIKGSYKIGGLIGIVKSNAMLFDISNCYADTQITTRNTSTDGSFVGGFIGVIHVNANISNCYSAGSIIGESGTTDHSYIAGFLGGNTSSVTDFLNIKNCSASVDLMLQDDSVEIRRIGGFVGQLWAEGSCKVSITDCFFTGDITVSALEASTIGGFLAISPSGTGNLFLSDCYSTGNLIISGSEAWQIGGFLGANFGVCSISNCYSRGSMQISSETIENTGGFLGGTWAEISILNSYTLTDMFLENGSTYFDDIGGFIGDVSTVGVVTNIENCYNKNKIETNLASGVVNNIGGFFGDLEYNGTILNVSNSYMLADKDSDIVSIWGGKQAGTTVNIENSYYNKEFANSGLNLFSDENGNVINDTNLVSQVKTCATDDPFQLYINQQTNLQVGISSGSSSNVTVDTTCSLKYMNVLRNIGLQEDDYLSKIDELMNDISLKQTQYGAANNRLLSAMEEISVQYENLVSSRSTIQDADMSEVSATYIQQQILQQASATLMATANQTPAIALQLI